MPVGRYKHVASRFKQWRILPPDCKSWIERRDEEPSAESSASNANAAAASIAASSLFGSGCPPENMTEERLYRSRLFDLALERHKKIQESDFVRNQFIDHQVRKARSKSLGRLLQGLDIEQYRNKSTSGIDKLHQRSNHTKLIFLANRRLGRSIEEVSKFSETELRSLLNIKDDATGIVLEPPSTAQFPPVHEERQPQRPSTSRTQVLHGPGGWTDQSAPLSSRSATRRPGSSAFAPAPTSALSPGFTGVTSVRPDRTYHRQSSSYRTRGSIAPGAQTSYGQSSSPDRRPRTASARRRIQSDPRCVQLINTLTPRYKPVGKIQDVDAIIRANPSLFRSTERSSDDEAQQQPQHQQHKQLIKTTKGRRTYDEAIEVWDNIVRTRYFEAGNLASLS